MRTIVALLLGLALAANGAFMLYDPAGWYATVPGVPDTGPLNPHFVRDIGCAYLLTGGAFIWLARDHHARMAALAGGVFLTLHALVHVADLVGGRSHAGDLPGDLATIFLPAAIALWIALSTPHMYGEPTMLKWLMRRWIDRFERTYGYDAGYVRDMLDVDAGAVMALSRISGLAGYHKGVPAEAWYAAKLVGTTAEDCGPCTQLAATMAERAGVAPAVLKAVLARNFAEMPEAVVIAVRFAEAALAHSPAADDLRDEIVTRWGREGLISLAFALAAARVYPTVKYALGHGKACQRVTVGGVAQPTLRRAA